MKKKLFLIVIPLLFLICFSSTASALSTEQGIGVDSPGLYTYVERFADFSGALIVTTTGVNNSGSDWMYITVVVICMDAERNFRLRIFDSDEDMFLETNNENGVGAKERRWEVRPHRDKSFLLWIASVTDLGGEIIYAQLSLFYTYDDTNPFRPPGEEDEIVDAEELRKAKIRTWTWSLQIVVGACAGLFLGIRFTNKLFGAG